MQLEYAFLCDAAAVSGDGKLSVLGIFDQIGAMQFPVVHRRMFLVVGIRYQVTEIGRRDVEVRAMNLDGQDVLPPLHMGVDFQRGGGLARLLGELNDVRFDVPGNYTFEIAVDRHHVKTIVLNVFQVAGPALFPPAPPNP